MALILTLNAGSSSLKFGLYTAEHEPQPVTSGMVEELGASARLVVKGLAPAELGETDHAGAVRHILKALEPHLGEDAVVGIGHRVVHGGAHHAEPAELTDSAMAELRELIPLAPLHQPHNLAGVTAAQAAFPNVPQIGCFDTAFHRSQPWVHTTFALPRAYYDEGVRRYGFHGLSYAYITEHLKQDYPDIATGRVIIAHLGNGGSLCAVQNGQSLATTMGFSVLEGLAMGTRSGRIDPGVLLFLMEEKGMGATEISDLLYRQSGLLGLSGISSDMRALEASGAPEAQDAIRYYVTAIQKEIGALAACLGGLDALVFTGGIGENAASIRQQVCQRLGFLGVMLDAEKNVDGPGEMGSGPVRVLVIRTDEEQVIARAVARHVRG